jgi:hypothetical protein
MSGLFGFCCLQVLDAAAALSFDVPQYKQRRRIDADPIDCQLSAAVE